MQPKANLCAKFRVIAAVSYFSKKQHAYFCTFKYDNLFILRGPKASSYKFYKDDSS